MLTSCSLTHKVFRGVVYRISREDGFLWILAKQAFPVLSVPSNKRFGRNTILDPIDQGDKKAGKGATLATCTVCRSGGFKITVEVA
jgi:hypothetical protein